MLSKFQCLVPVENCHGLYTTGYCIAWCICCRNLSKKDCWNILIWSLSTELMKLVLMLTDVLHIHTLHLSFSLYVVLDQERDSTYSRCIFFVSNFCGFCSLVLKFSNIFIVKKLLFSFFPFFLYFYYPLWYVQSKSVRINRFKTTNVFVVNFCVKHHTA